MLSQPLPRRRLLKLFTKSSALLVPAASIQLLACSSESSDNKAQPGPYPTTFGKLLVLDQNRAQVLFAFAEACVPNTNGEIKRARVMHRIDEELYFVSGDIREDFLLALDVMQYLPMVYGYFSRFSKLTLADRNALLRALQQTRLDTVSAVLNACRMAVMMMYYGHESTWAPIQYDGTFSRAPQIHSLQRRRYQQLTQASGEQ